MELQFVPEVICLQQSWLVALSVIALSLLSDVIGDIVYIGNGYIGLNMTIQTDHMCYMYKASLDSHSGLGSCLRTLSVKSCFVEELDFP